MNIIQLLEADQQNGRARVVRRRIAPGYGEKHSANGYSYEDDPFVLVADAVNKLVDQGVPVISRLGHPEKGERAELLPAISTLTHHQQHRAVEVDRATGEVFVVDRFIEPGTEKSIEWSERAYRKEYLPCSFEAYAYCAKKIIDGADEEEIRCEVAHLFCVAWLDPAVDQPGMGEGARMTDVLEHSHGGQQCPCGCAGTDPIQCLRYFKRNSKQSHSNSNNLEAGDQNSSGGKTKGARKTMDLIQLAKDLYAQGAPLDAGLKIIKGQGEGASPEDVMAAMDSFIGMFSGAPTGDDMPLPPESLQQSNPDLYELRKRRYEALQIKKQEAARAAAAGAGNGNGGNHHQSNNYALLATIESQRQDIASLRAKMDEMAKKPAPSPFTSEKEKKIWEDFMAERDHVEVNQATVKQVYEALTAEKFGGHNLKDQRLYPIGLVNGIAKEAEAKIVKENLDFKSISLWIDGQLLGLVARAPEETQENRPRMEFGEGSDISKRLKDLSEAADRAALQRDGGEEFLEKRGKIAKKIEPQVKRIKDYHRDAVGHVLHMSEMVLRDKRLGRVPNHELAAEGLACGLITNEAAYTNTATNVATQAFMSELIYNRLFEPADYLDIIAALLRTELYDYQAGDPFGLQVGDEVKWALHRGIDPANISQLKVKVPGKSALTSARLDRKYDSVSLEELAIDFLYELMQVNSLRNTWNVDYVGAIGDYIADLMNRSLSKFGMTKYDNTARQFRAVEVTEATINNSNITSSNVIVVDGVTITYHTDIADIIRLTMDQPSDTGTDVAARLIVMPEEDKYNKPRGGKQTDIKNPITFTLNSVDYDWDDIGELDYATMNIVDRYKGQNALFAIDFNNCLLLAKSGANISTGNKPTNLKYSYVALLTQTAGNLIMLDFTVPDTTTEPLHINNLLNTLTTAAALRGKQAHVRPNLFFTSKVVTDGLLTKAARWQEEFRKIGSELTPNFEDFNTIGRISGGIDLWGTDGYLLGAEGVGILTRRGSTKVVFGEKVQSSGMRWIELTGAAENDPTNSTTGQKEQFRQTFAFASPRVRDDNGLADNEPGICCKILGASFTA